MADFLAFRAGPLSCWARRNAIYDPIDPPFRDQAAAFWRRLPPETAKFADWVCCQRSLHELRILTRFGALARLGNHLSTGAKINRTATRRRRMVEKRQEREIEGGIDFHKSEILVIHTK